MPSRTAVSYTHLDVYKRQVIVIGKVNSPFGRKVCLFAAGGGVADLPVRSLLAITRAGGTSSWATIWVVDV